MIPLLNFLTNFSLIIYLAYEFSETNRRFKELFPSPGINAALLRYDSYYKKFSETFFRILNMRYHPRIQMSALKVGFHAFFLKQY